jgi:hypothetical protein
MAVEIHNRLCALRYRVLLRWVLMFRRFKLPQQYAPLKYTYPYTRLHGVTIQKNTYTSNYCNFIVNPVGVTRLMTLRDVGVAVERVASCSVVWKSRREVIPTYIVPDFPRSV